MNSNRTTILATRGNILKLLSDDEIASVSTTEATAHPLDGEEYLDLEDLAQGVRNSLSTAPPMGRVLLRRSIHANTWNKILEQLVVLHMAKAHTRA
jgi:hypothetical protein